MCQSSPITNFTLHFFCCIYAVIFFYFAVTQPLHADKPYFDLSDETIKIETTFKGKEIIIFGLADSNYDTILLINIVLGIDEGNLCADLNADTNYNIVDIILLINIILTP